MNDSVPSNISEPPNVKIALKQAESKMYFEDLINTDFSEEESMEINSNQEAQGQLSHRPEEQPNHAFHFFKNQEIPQFFYDMKEDTFSKVQSSQAIWDDCADFKIEIFDNGDDRVAITGKN